MPHKQHRIPWRERFNLKYAPVLREIPALIRLETFKLRTVSSLETVLIVNCCLIGDFIVSLPAITEFISEHANVQIDLLVAPNIAPLARKLRGIRQVYTAQSVFGHDTEPVGSDQRLASSYDLVVVLRLSEPARQLLSTTSYRTIKTYLRPLLKYALHLAKQPSADVKQLSEFDFEVFGKLGRHAGQINADEIFDFSDAPAVDAPVGRTVLVHTGSDSRVHLWPVSKWVALLEEVHEWEDVSFLFVGGTEEEERRFGEISRRTSFPLHSVIRRYNILELAMLMRMSHLFVGVDSGPRHLAHLVDLPSVCLLGPGPKSFQPLNHNATVIDETECRRCVTFYCPYSPSCVGKIEVDTVVRACRHKLSAVRF